MNNYEIIYSVLSPILPSYANYADLSIDDDFAVFSFSSAEIRTKEKKIYDDITLTISIFSKELNNAAILQNAIEAALETPTNAQIKFASKITSDSDFDFSIKRTITTLQYKLFVK